MLIDIHTNLFHGINWNDFLSTKFDKIEESVKSDLLCLAHDNPSFDIDQYWRDQFFDHFKPPNFEGLEPSYKAMITHYWNKHFTNENFSDSEDEEGFDTTEIRYETIDKDEIDKTHSSGANATNAQGKYYQNPDDILYAPVGHDDTLHNDIDNQENLF